MSQETPKYEPTPEEIKGGEEMMSTRRMALSEIREEAYNQLSEEDKELLKDIDLCFDDNGKGNYSSIYGTVKGHTLLMRKSDGRYSARLENEDLSHEQAENTYNKYAKLADLFPPKFTPYREGSKWNEQTVYNEEISPGAIRHFESKVEKKMNGNGVEDIL